MLTNLSIKNIKSFNKEASIKIAPITLIYGANSSGKSTLWKFLATLRSSLGTYQGKNFINFSRSFGFANNRTISFNPKLPSTFGFKFSSIYEFYKAEKTEILSSKIASQEDQGVRFIFSFNNQDEVDENKKSEDLNEYDKIIDRIKSKNTITSDEQDLLKTVEKLREKEKKIIKEIQKAENILDPKKEKNINLNELSILKNGKIFAIYKIYKLNSDLVSRRFSQRITREAKLKNKKNLELEIKKILKENFGDKFKFEYKLKTNLRRWDEYSDEKLEKKTLTFDFVGPDGPHDIKISEEDSVGYLFIPSWISDDKFFWEEHYEILQTMKKLMQNNKSNKEEGAVAERNIYKRYFEEEYNNIVNYYDAVHGIPADDLKKEVPEISASFTKILDAMTSSFDDFVKIMTEDFKTQIFKGSSFIPTRNFYGGRIYQGIFDTLATKWVDTFVETDQKNISKEGDDFLNKYSSFVKFSYDDQFKNLSNFNRELRNFKNISTENYRVGMGMGRMYPSIINGMLHEDRELKAKIIKLLEKINLPFNIETQTDEEGDIRVSFSNKKIKDSQDGIPLEQSGNALGSILNLLTELIKSNNDTIIIEEPENKIHPKIQGNLIELISEIIKNNSSNVIIETHSEHFILRIQKLIRENKIKPSLVSINYVYLDENGEGSKIDHMSLDNKGKFIKKWRHGFFNERLKEI